MQVHLVNLMSSDVQMACALMHLGYVMDKITVGIGLMSSIVVSNLHATIDLQVYVVAILFTEVLSLAIL